MPVAEASVMLTWWELALFAMWIGVLLWHYKVAPRLQARRRTRRIMDRLAGADPAYRAPVTSKREKDRLLTEILSQCRPRHPRTRTR